MGIVSLSGVVIVGIVSLAFDWKSVFGNTVVNMTVPKVLPSPIHLHVWTRNCSRIFSQSLPKGNCQQTTQCGSRT